MKMTIRRSAHRDSPKAPPVQKLGVNWQREKVSATQTVLTLI
jgi:hypothetical protein